MRRILSDVRIEEDDDYNLGSYSLKYGVFGDVNHFLRVLYGFSILFVLYTIGSYVFVLFEFIEDGVPEPVSRRVNLVRFLIHVCIGIVILVELSIVFIFILYFLFVFVNIIGKLSWIIFCSGIILIDGNNLIKSTYDFGDNRFVIEKEEDIVDLEVSEDNLEIVTEDDSYNIGVSQAEDIHRELYNV